MKASLASALFVLVLTACAGPDPRTTGPAPPLFRALPPGPLHERGRIELTGPGTEDARLAVVVDAGDGVIEMLGSAGRRAGALFFVPRFPFTLGHEYTARMTASSGQVTDFPFTFPAPVIERTTRVDEVQPGGDVLPENLLKFYLHFSAPMRRGEAYEHVRLVSDHGVESRDAFLDVEPELWDPGGTRLTLFIEPGRIKRGLALRDELGPVLEAGHSYRLEVDADWRDARGARLAEPFVKTFRAVDMDTAPPEPTRWRLAAPPAGGRAPLRVDLAEPLDAALLARCLHVRHAGGERLAGTARVATDAAEWSWEPTHAWRAGRYELIVDPILEDLAGNSVGRPFEVLLDGEAQPEARAEPVTLTFEVAPVPR